MVWVSGSPLETQLIFSPGLHHHVVRLFSEHVHLVAWRSHSCFVIITTFIFISINKLSNLKFASVMFDYFNSFDYYIVIFLKMFSIFIVTIFSFPVLLKFVNCLSIPVNQSEENIEVASPPGIGQSGGRPSTEHDHLVCIETDMLMQGTPGRWLPSAKKQTPAS